MAGSVAEDLGAPESWEVADLDAAVSRLMLSSSKSSNDSAQQEDFDIPSTAASASCASSSALISSKDKVPEEVINRVDQFLREALNNPRERLSVLRMEQDVEKFIRDPTRQQMEFQQLPTSYLRLAAHRVAQHYSLQSMVLVDNSLPDGSGARIIVRKTSVSQPPLVRLADIPVNFPSEESGVVKLAIKQRPQKQPLQILSNSSQCSSKTNYPKTVEERKEEYNRARARIFNSSSGNGPKIDCDHRLQDGPRLGSTGASRMEDRTSSTPDMNYSRGLIDANNSRASRSKVEKESFLRNKPGNRVAIFRDRETERKDPDYDRSYDRYIQRFDPGFGFNNGPYTIQPMFTHAVNYNTEFPQLGSAHRPQMAIEHQHRPLPQHLHGPWGAPSAPAGLGYGHPEAMMTPFSPGPVGARPTSPLYLHSPQFACQRPGVAFIHSHEHVNQPFAQSHQPQSDASFGLARPR